MVEHQLDAINGSVGSALLYPQQKKNMHHAEYVVKFLGVSLILC
ncbi:hypothetical protein RUMOBE_03955 [Blautia obeum ATCC 29174]|jgi:hypothetical protein|uniref:Uncharacterized protein n=1 Tax=Blautia obeum ATCC 29174 TaxID=411459 RepID=A5ZY47_9FIRM|nr:hypothetical protein RUMOBE_03955 [Blautia obeum ATCC 29174]